jgi:cytochrome c-type biogenesis protein CcmH/NrfG
MALSDGRKPGEAADKSLGEVVAEVSEKASLLVRQEIELAKAEVKDKISKLTKGAVVGGVAAIVLVFAVVYLLSALAWFFADLYGGPYFEIWLGFLTVFFILLAVAGLAAFVAFRWLRRGSPPTPELAIEEARRTRLELERQQVQRDQLERALARHEELQG